MQISSKMLYRTAVVFLGVLLALGVFMAMNGASEKANAMNVSEWTQVRTNLDNFITSQYVADTVDGESGFRIDATTLKGRTDSNGDGVYLGEGDDAANAPVLVDVLNAYQGTFIQATSVVSTWNTTATDVATTNLIASKVANHETAGFSTDIITYCLTGHTESVVAGAMGAISHAGGYGGATAPTVLALDWGRWGWNTGTHSYTKTNTLATASAPPVYPAASNANCSGADPELTRCIGNWALSAAGGNVGSGFTAGATTGYAGMEVIDLRTAPGATSPSNSASTVHVPLNTVFNTGLAAINPLGGQKLAGNRTQHTSNMVAVGLEMLGYNSTGAKWGLAEYNNTIGEQKIGAGAGYGLVAAVVDTTTPTITSGPTATPGSTTASIALTTDEPATTKVDYGTTAGGPYGTTINDTILNASSTASLSGLTPGTTYYAVVTACDGQANCTTAAEISFTTTCSAGNPGLTLMAPTAYWATMADYTNGVLSVDWTISNPSADGAYNVQLLSSSSTYAPVTTITMMPVAYGTIAGVGSGVGTVQYKLPTGFAGSGFHVINTASADDQCGNGYTYP